MPTDKAIGDKVTNTIDSVTGKIKDTLTPEVPTTDPKITEITSKRMDTLQQVENNNGRVAKIVADATKNGIDVKNIVANTDLLQGSVDENGNINTLGKGEAVDQFNQQMGQYESSVSDGLAREGKSIPLTDVESALKYKINGSRLAGSSKARLTNLVNQEMEGLKLDADENGNISLSKLQDAKISTTNGIDYTKPETKINAKLIGNTYKTLIEDNSALPIKALNAELSKYYKIGDYLEALNGKKVQGGKLGKYFASTVGSIAGSHFGPLGTIIGAEIASKIKGMNMSSTFGAETGQTLTPSDLMKQTFEQNKQPRIGLPTPKEGSVKSQNFVPIELGGKSTIEPQAINSRINGQTKANTSPDNATGQSTKESNTAATQNNGERVITKKIPRNKK